MAKQLNIDLSFSADTSKALKTLQELRQNLNSIASIDISTQNLSQELKTAVSSAQALQTHLNNAFNVKTGNLDLSRLNSSLKQSGASLSTLSNNLLGAGISGERAFLQIQSSIASANTQLVKSNGLISNFMTTLKNTARWQISSSVLHGFMGAMQSAYGYAQDLNESLTNIRIVTGANADEMARFANEANKSAKALSTTTTDYTNASLIYFQQGLNEKQVKERTDITIKMANAAGQSVGIVSDQLTAVWNNFDDGSKSLEYYADVMAALGAATASSTDEIAGGLEKFAAVADTIGLSYEYAASALATITSNTRQSEEVVGTALKTIFARIQGLNLGETLDDGTTLNKYSEALQKVGISIFDSAGQLKNMDSILDEMAAKWNTLAKDQQVALAQTVAGVRQYNQLVSLMDNWNAGDSDSMIANLETAYGSTGTLQQQADIYEESWEAASNRVRASLEAIYKELVPDDTFIGLFNGLEKVLTMVEALVKAFGGLEGILLLVSSIALNKFSANIGEGIQAGIDKVKTLSTTLKGIGSYLKTTFKAAGLGIAGATQATFQSKSKNEDGTFAKTDGFVKMAEAAKMAQTSMRSATSEIEKQQALSLQQASATERTTDAFKIQTQTLQQTTALTKTVKDNAKLFTEETSQQLLNEIESVRVLGEKRALLKEQEEVLREQNRNLIEDAAEELHADAPDASGYSLQGDSAQGQVSQILKDNIKSLAQISGLSKGLVVGVNKATGEMKLFNTETKQANDDFSNLESLVTTSVSQITQVSSVTAQLKDINLDDTFASAADKAAAMQQVLNKTTGISDSLRQKLQSAIDALKSGNAKQFNTILSRTGVEAKNIAKALGVSEEVIKKATQAGQKQAANIKQQAAAQNEYNNALNTASQNIQNALANASKLGPTIAQGLSQFSSLAMSISSVSNAVDTLSDSSASWTQKLTASAMALTMGFRGFMIVIQDINTVLTAMNSTQAISNALASAQVVLTGQMTAAKAKETVGTIAQLAVEQKLNAAQVAAMLTEELGLGSKQANALARLLVAGAASTEAGAITSATAAEAADIAAKKAGTAANIAYAASQWLAYWPMLLIVAALAAIVAIIVAVNKAEQARIENNKKMAERSKETADALQEEVNANEELMKTYQEALSTYEETGNNKDALREAALKLASAYGIEGAAVDALAGDYDSLTKKIQRARVEELKQLKEAKDNAMQDAGTVFGDVTSGVITGDTYRQGFGVGWSKDDETAALNTFNQDYQYLKLNESGRVDAMADMSDPKQMYAYFQELENWIKAQEEYARENDLNLSASELYTSAVAEMEAGKEYYNQLKEYMSEASEIQAEISAYDTLITTNGKTKGINDIDNLNDYLEFEKEFTKNYATSMGFAPDTEQWAEAEKYAKNYLTVFEDLNKFQLEARGFEGLIDNKDYDLIKQYYDTLSESEKEVFWTAGIDENSSMAEITSFMDNAQSYLNANSLYATITLKDEAVSAFDQGDYKTLKTIFENEDSPYNMEWMDFLSMSFAEQEDYIKNAYVDYNEILAANSKALKDNAENVKVAEQAYNDATSKVEKASVAWQNAASDVVDHDKVISDAKTQFGYGSTLDGEYYHHIINSGKYTGLDMSNYREENGRIVFDVGGFNAYKMFSDINLSDYLAENNPFAQQWQTYMDYVNQYQTALDNHDDSTANQTYQDFYSWMNSSGFYKDMAAMAYGTGNYDGQYGQAELEGLLLTGLSNVFSSGDTTNPMTVGQQKDAAQYFLDALMFQMDQEHKGLQGVEGEKKGVYDDAVTVQGEKKTAWDTAAITNQESLLVDKSLTEAARQQEFEKNNEKYGLNTEEVSEYADHLRNLSEAGELTNTVLSDQPFIADRVAQGIMRMNKGVEDLTGGFKDWTKVLKSTDKSTAKYGTALKSLRKATENILDIEADQLTDSFFESAEAMELLGRVAEGDLEAIDELRVLAAKDIILGAEYDLDGISETEQAILDSIAGLESENLEIGATLNESQFGQSLLNAAIAAQGTVSDIQGMFESLGWEPEITTTKIPISQAIQQMSGSGFVDVVDPLTGDVTRVTTQEQMNGMSSDGMVEVFSINGDASVYKGGGGSTATPPKGGGGGGGGKPKKAEKVKKSDVVDRYKEVNDLLDDLHDKMEDTSKVADRLYGKGRLDQMKKNNELLKQEIELTKKKKEEALKYLDEDKQSLFDAAAEAGVVLNIDDNGLITNYTDAMTELYEELDAEITAANKDGNATEDEQARIDKIQERIDELKDAIDQYDETRELIEDLDNELDEQFYQWQDNNYEMLTYELEIKLELNEDELKVIDYYLNKISDDFYQMAEAAALMVSSGDSTTGMSQLEMYTSNLASYEEHMRNLEDAYANGEISQEAYVEGMREVQDGMISNLESLNELDETMMHYYGDTLDMAAEEIAKYTDRMAHQTEVLDHYQSLMEIMGKSTDYKAMGVILEGKAKTLGNQAAVAKETMQMYKDEADDRYLAYQQALLDGDEAAAELYLQQYEDALAAANEAESEYLSSAAEWAEALKAVLENKLADFGQTLENALTGGTSFDQMTTAMERAASLQEEYLTTTNKIYETNKLMRTAQQEIDKTSNTVAKRRLQDFIKETDQLQNKTKLSNYELEIQQAKYDLLLAEIALEEAQNAKSTVRLQRDSEGNFGYVYTADSEAISAAEQEMLDKQNSLYNIALEGANDYSSKYQQTLNEMHDTLTDLQSQYLERAFESEEEYHAAVEAAKQYYYEKLEQYSSLHAVALTTDTRVINDAWSADFNDMMDKTEVWKEAVNSYVTSVQGAFSEWNIKMGEIAVDTGTDLNNMEQNVKDITTESDNLKKAIIGEDGKGGVVAAVKTEIEAVKEITEKYATLRSSLETIKKAYEDVTAAINATIRAQAQVSSNPGVSTTTYKSSSGGGQGNASHGADTGGSGSGGGGGGGGGQPKTTAVTLYASPGGGTMGTYTLTKGKFTVSNHLGYDSKYYNYKVTNQSGPSGYVSSSDRSKLINLDTGGYTGSWGSYGKLAMLHEKELILNKDDTENFLASMEVLERILQIIDLQSSSSQLGGSLSAPGFNSNTGTLEQNVHIEANFPNVSHSEEIEEAFSNLVNLASQYAYRS